MSNFQSDRVGRINFPPARQWLFPLLVVAGVVLFAKWVIAPSDSGHLEMSLWLGVSFGALLQRSRFCFYCVSRDFFERRDAAGLLGIVASLAVGLMGYHFIFGAFMPVPRADRLPPGAHIGPISWVLVVGAFTFGIGMSLARSCVSALFYRLGEGMATAPIGLLGVIVGFALGFASWNTLYLQAIQSAPVIWLPHYLGYEGALWLQLVVLAFVALVLAWRHQIMPASNTTMWWRKRWPTWAGGLLIGALAALAYLRVGPFGVTAEIGSLARTGADAFGWLPARLEGLDTFRGCATVIKETLWSNNGLFVIGVTLGALVSALSAGDVVFKKPPLKELTRTFAGGVLMGWGAMVALGCTVGTLLSGIMASALSGWVFAVFCMAGLYLGWRIQYRG
ncbi:YeeE/YedE family protein [Halomonas sp. SpR8]|uniref:YeeE/YedE family protein n=1 Tax=Halomonas sp. SpR8 TaxID=3050463 RepID=UPI0027E5946C|nr:YeeE/YedE family protein [Halomonas sp. SpR8]MDQ7730983.1 YeeE/YedE family protein [Halomonas sp. SpR8]